MQYHFDVLHDTGQEGRSLIVTEYVTGTPLIQYVQEHSKLRKEELFSWFVQILQQTIPLQQQVTPFHLIRTSRGEIRILDFHAPVNRKYLSQIDTDPLIQKFSTEKEQSLRQTIQFLLAKTEPSPRLTRREERRLLHFISNQNSKQKKKRKRKWVFCWIPLLLIFLCIPKYRTAPEPIREQRYLSEEEETLSDFVLCVRTICQNEDMSIAEKEEQLTQLIRESPQMIATEQFQKLEREHGFFEEGGTICFRYP